MGPNWSYAGQTSQRWKHDVLMLVEVICTATINIAEPEAALNSIAESESMGREHGLLGNCSNLRPRPTWRTSDSVFFNLKRNE